METAGANVLKRGENLLVIFLTGRIPKRQLDLLSIDLDIGDVVLKNGGDVDLKETISTLDKGRVESMANGPLGTFPLRRQ